MKIAVVVPNVTMPDEALAERHAFLQRISRPDTEIHVVRNDSGPESIESEFEREWASVHILEHMLRLAPQGFDAFIPWCANDPAVIPGRERLDVPVVGPFQSACLYAAGLGFRFSTLSPRSNPRLTRQRVAALGLKALLASTREIDRTVPELRADLDATCRLLSAEIAEAAHRDGADAVVLGCMALFGITERLETPVPVVDPARAAIAMAETLVAMGLTHAGRAYTYPGRTAPPLPVV